MIGPRALFYFTEMYGTGFPKGTARLKPAWEPILLCRKPGKYVLPLQIDRCRVGVDGVTISIGKPNGLNQVYGKGFGGLPIEKPDGLGRWTVFIHRYRARNRIHGYSRKEDRRSKVSRSAIS